MTAVQSEHPYFTTTENSTNQLLEFHDSFQGCSSLHINLIAILLKPWQNIEVIESFQLQKAWSASITVLSENHAKKKSAIILKCWAGKYVQNKHSDKSIVSLGKESQINA